MPKNNIPKINITPYFAIVKKNVFFSKKKKKKKREKQKRKWNQIKKFDEKWKKEHELNVARPRPNFARSHPTTARIDPSRVVRKMKKSKY